VIIAEVATVRRVYPDVPEDAVQHLLWCLHRARRDIEDGNRDAALTSIRTDLAAYTGSLEDFTDFELPLVMRAIAGGRLETADILGRLRLLQPPGAPR
jgi:hypothetical protein